MKHIFWLAKIIEYDNILGNGLKNEIRSGYICPHVPKSKDYILKFNHEMLNKNPFNRRRNLRTIEFSYPDTIHILIIMINEDFPLNDRLLVLNIHIKKAQNNKILN